MSAEGDECVPLGVGPILPGYLVRTLIKKRPTGGAAGAAQNTRLDVDGAAGLVSALALLECLEHIERDACVGLRVCCGLQDLPIMLPP